MDMTLSSRHARRFGLGGAVIAAALALAGCTNPYDPSQRALGGAAIGAGAGAALSAASGGSAASGALVGGAIGAIGGALTTPHPPPPPGYYRDGSGYRSGDYRDRSDDDRYRRDRRDGYDHRQGDYPQNGYYGQGGGGYYDQNGGYSSPYGR